MESCTVTGVFFNNGTQINLMTFIYFAFQRPTTARVRMITAYNAYEQHWHCKALHSEQENTCLNKLSVT